MSVHRIQQVCTHIPNRRVNARYRSMLARLPVADSFAPLQGYVILSSGMDHEGRSAGTAGTPTEVKFPVYLRNV